MISIYINSLSLSKSLVGLWSNRASYSISVFTSDDLVVATVSTCRACSAPLDVGTIKLPVVAVVLMVYGTLHEMERESVFWPRARELPACKLLRDLGTGVLRGDTNGLAFAEFDLDARPLMGECGPGEIGVKLNILRRVFGLCGTVLATVGVAAS